MHTSFKNSKVYATSDDTHFGYSGPTRKGAKVTHNPDTCRYTQLPLAQQEAEMGFSM